jgi:hypothetical protein
MRYKVANVAELAKELGYFPPLRSKAAVESNGHTPEHAE